LILTNSFTCSFTICSTSVVVSGVGSWVSPLTNIICLTTLSVHGRLVRFRFFGFKPSPVNADSSEDESDPEPSDSPISLQVFGRLARVNIGFVSSIADVYRAIMSP
jgi:hypothetical protein